MIRRFTALFMIFGLMTSLALAQESVVSKKQDVAVFALGYFGYNIPLETLATVDAEIQNVFIQLGRFNVLGQTERFSSGDVQAFIDLLKKAKETNTPLPEEVKFGEVQITEALLNQLYGAFVVVIPTVVDYSTEYNSKQNQWETTIKTSFAFLDVANSTSIGFAIVETSGSSKETELKAVRSAINGIAGRLNFEVRNIPAFTISSRVLQVSGNEVKMQLGKDMGIVVGDEYLVIESSTIAGLTDEREDGLLLVKNVGPEISTLTVLIGGKSLAEGAQLREIPRQGGEVAPYLRVHQYFDGGLTAGVGAKIQVTRHFYNFRPVIGFEVLIDTDKEIPIQAYIGGEFNLFFGRFAANVMAAGGAGTNALMRLLDDKLNDSDDPWVSHYGLTASVGGSFLINRDIKILVDAGFDYWVGLANKLGPAWDSFGSLFAGAGVSFKL